MGYLRKIPAYLLLTVALGACQSTALATRAAETAGTQAGEPEFDPGRTPAQNPAPASTPENEDTVMNMPLTPDATAQKMIDLAKRYLAQRLGIAVEDITLIEVKPAIWRDASLGCPKPAVDYIPMETPGFRIVLATGEKPYNLHTDEIRRVVLCARP